MSEPQYTPEDYAIRDYLEEHHKIDVEMAFLAGHHLTNSVIRAFRAGAAWQRQQTDSDSEKVISGKSHSFLSESN
jgi:hypothetical protein